jgi:hypothetical protein
MGLINSIISFVQGELVYAYNHLINQLHLAGFLNPESRLSPAAQARAIIRLEALARAYEDARLQVWNLSSGGGAGLPFWGCLGIC